MEKDGENVLSIEFLYVLIGCFLLNMLLAKIKGKSIPRVFLFSWLSGIIPVTIYLLFAFYDKNRICAWCGNKKIKFKTGDIVDWHWKYRNQDGSRDKRVKDNYEQATYRSLFNCEICEAETFFRHFVDKNPNVKKNVWSRELVKDGKGNRTGFDSNSFGKGKTYSPKSANRKNNKS